MNSWHLVLSNLASPMVLAFVMGLIATWVRSDLRLPQELYTTLSFYLLFSLGLKGGAELVHTPFLEVWKPILVTLALGVGIPLLAYLTLRRLGRLGVTDAAAIAAHYGSVSVVTFSAAQTVLVAGGFKPEGFLPALVALLEAPAILVALGLARLRTGRANGEGVQEALRDLLTGKSIFALVGGLLIGALSGPEGIKPVAAFFLDPFKGALTLFLLELGMVTARRLRDLARAPRFLWVYAVLGPVFHGSVGVMLGTLAGLSVGGSAVLGAMAASASYIAAPAAVRVALPDANPGYYLGMALGITFPFNLTLGIPLYAALSLQLHGGHG